MPAQPTDERKGRGGGGGRGKTRYMRGWRERRRHRKVKERKITLGPHVGGVSAHTDFSSVVTLHFSDK